MKVSWKIIAVFFIAAIIGFLVWYKYAHSMEIAKPFEINSPQLEQKVLIATQGSEYKGILVDDLIGRLKDRSVYIKVVDVSALPLIEVDDYTAIVVIHTWEMQKPPAVVEQFLKQSKNLGKVVVLTTAGGSDASMEGIDAISSESVISEIPDDVNQLMSKLELLL